MKKNYLLIVLSAILLIFGNIEAGYAAGKGKNVKYVFLFIGDGMGLAHISMTEAYLATQKGVIGNEQLTFTGFPVTGLVTTYSASNFITCSSAAGTALATGTKTNNYMLGVDPQKNKLKAITYKIHEKGIPVGVMSTVSIDHATPGAFYASSVSRTNYYEIAEQLPATGFEFFGGGGFVQLNGEKKDKPLIYDVIKQSGYKIAFGIDELSNISKNDKVVLLQKANGKSELPLAIDRKQDDLTLKQLVDAAISRLESKKGFFMMAEGGQIDWAAHSNDVKSAILEVLDMDEAIKSAYEFYLKHPDETLILVTADHETGGLAVGKDAGYNINLKELNAQTQSMAAAPGNIPSINSINSKALVGWTTKSHTGIMVPIFAIGAGSELFTGRMDNTDIPRKICKLMGITF